MDGGRCVPVISRASPACVSLTGGGRRHSQSRDLSPARSPRITHASRDPKIPILPTGTRRVCGVLTLFLDTLPGTSRNGVPATTNRQPPTIGPAAAFGWGRGLLGNIEKKEKKKKRRHDGLCSKRRGKERGGGDATWPGAVQSLDLAGRAGRQSPAGHCLSEGMASSLGLRQLAGPIHGDGQRPFPGAENSSPSVFLQHPWLLLAVLL